MMSALKSVMNLLSLQYMCVWTDLVIVQQTHNRGAFRVVLPHFKKILIRYSIEIFVPVHVSIKTESGGNESSS